MKTASSARSPRLSILRSLLITALAVVVASAQNEQGKPSPGTEAPIATGKDALFAFPTIDKLVRCDTLPDLFRMLDGSKITSRDQWLKRRKELLEMIQHYQYGFVPARSTPRRLREIHSSLLDGKAATYKVVRLQYGPRQEITAYLYLAIPKGNGPHPVVVTGDRCWYSRIDSCEQVTDRGYVLAEFDRTCFDHDDANRLDGLHLIYPGSDFGTLAAWAWGYMKMVDFLETCSFVDRSKIIITGHSRAGKAVLLAGALDDRIALTVPNGSGQGGAGPLRTRYLFGRSESVSIITAKFPYWFNERFRQFNDNNIALMPYDQHALIAAIAPRAYLSTYALDDAWANPQGTMIVHKHALKAFESLNAQQKAGIHFRKGGHAHNGEDWNAMLDFAEMVLSGKKVARRFDLDPFAK